MPLAGTFDVLDFGETLNLLAKRSVTGRLQVRTASMHGIIWLAEGQAAAAEVGNPNDDETRVRWQDHIEDICFDALRSLKGTFEFQPEDSSAVPTGARVGLDAILEGGRHRVEMWEAVEPVIRSFDAVPHLADSLDSDSLTLDRNSWKVLAAIDGRRNVSALGRRVSMRVLDLCVLLKPLIECGGVALEHPESWAKSLPKVRLDTEMSSGAAPVVATELPDGEENVKVLNGNDNGDSPDLASNGDAGLGYGDGSDGMGGPADGQLPPDKPEHEPRRPLLRTRSKKPAEPANP